MVNVESDYIGTETKIDRVGRFDCVVKDYTKSRNKNDSKTKDEVICRLEVPNGYHFKEGFMASFDSDTKPDMLIKAISPYTTHSVCELVSWS